MTETDDLIALLESRGTSIKLLKITEEQVKYIKNELPKNADLSGIHQIVFFCDVLMILKIAFNQTILS